MDMRRKSPLPAGTNTDTSPPRLMRGNPLDMPAGSAGAVQPPLTPLAPGLPMPSLAKISNVSNASTNASLSEEYSAEADLIGRQIGMLVHLMQVAAAAAAKQRSTATGIAAEASTGGAGCSRGGGTGSILGEVASSKVSGADGAGPQAIVRRNSLGGASAAAVLRRYSSSGARSNRSQLSAYVLEAARQLLCIQVGHCIADTATVYCRGAG